MSEKQIDEQILDNEVVDSNKNEEMTEEKDPFLERIKKLDNNERIFKKDEEFIPSEDNTKEIIEEKNNDIDISYDEKETEDKQDVIPSKKNKKKGFLVILVVLVLILGGVLCVFFVPGAKQTVTKIIRENPISNIININKEDKYNPMGYPVIEGKTFGDAANVYNCSYKKFLADNNFPSDIPKNTPIFVAEYYMRVKDVAEKNYSTDYETFKSELGIPESATLENGKTIKINENTMWYIVKDELPLSSIVKERDFLEYKAYYGLGDEVTTDTLYKEVRPQIEKVLVEEVKVKYGLIEKTEEETSNNTENQTEETPQPEIVEQEQPQTEEDSQTEQTVTAEEEPTSSEVTE